MRISAQLEPRMRRLGATDLDLLERLFEPLPDCPFFVKDDALCYVAANAAMARLCGVRAAAELAGRRARDFFSAAQAARYEALDRQVLATGRPITNHLDLSLPRRSSSAWLLFTRTPVRSAAGEVVGIAAVSRRALPSRRTDALYARLAEAAERIRMRPEAPLDIAELAKGAGVSKSQIERDFAQLFATTPTRFLHQARVEKAARLLMSGASVAEAAYACGYADQSAFTRRFKQMTGLTPRQYRARTS
jgi:AraC-like DNA-binding protein